MQVSAQSTIRREPEENATLSLESAVAQHQIAFLDSNIFYTRTGGNNLLSALRDAQSIQDISAETCRVHEHGAEYWREVLLRLPNVRITREVCAEIAKANEAVGECVSFLRSNYVNRTRAHYQSERATERVQSLMDFEKSFFHLMRSIKAKTSPPHENGLVREIFEFLWKYQRTYQLVKHEHIVEGGWKKPRGLQKEFSVKDTDFKLVAEAFAAAACGRTSVAILSDDMDIKTMAKFLWSSLNVRGRYVYSSLMEQMNQQGVQVYARIPGSYVPEEDMYASAFRTTNENLTRKIGEKNLFNDTDMLVDAGKVLDVLVQRWRANGV